MMKNKKSRGGGTKVPLPQAVYSTGLFISVMRTALRDLDRTIIDSKYDSIFFINADTSK